jgi:hypothetical protein
MVRCFSKTKTGKRCRCLVVSPNTMCHTHIDTCSICYTGTQPHELLSFGCCNMVFCPACRSRKSEFSFVCPGCRASISLNESELLLKLSIDFKNISTFIFLETGQCIFEINIFYIFNLFDFIFSQPAYITYVLLCENSTISESLLFYASIVSSVYPTAALYIQRWKAINRSVIY